MFLTHRGRCVNVSGLKYLDTKQPELLVAIALTVTGVIYDFLIRQLDKTTNVSNGDEELTPVPFSIKEKIDKELDRLEKSQIIEKVNASDWSTPLVTVIKSNGELRLCGDFKNTLNNCIEDEKYPLPTIETILGNLGGNKIFTKLDLSSAYHQIEMDEASKNLLVVSTHRGLYRYNRLPFGISPASAIFQRCMDSLFHDVPNTVIYLDDIFIGSKDEQKHYRILKMIFDKLKELNFTLNKEKCFFLKKDICFLGHIINEDGVRPDSKKLEALERCKKPFDKTSLKSFLGMLSFYSKYIPNMSTLAGPLYQLLKKDNRWKWSSQCEKAFLNLKLTLLNSQALIHYSMKLPLTLTCDASAYGISGVLCHIVEGEEKPITFVSRTLSSAEVKYSQTEKEALAIVFATSKLRQYLFGRKFVLKSDHKALTTVFGNKSLLPPLIANRLHRWALELSNFDFDIRYTNKDTMLCADAFSRLPLEEINSREDNIDLVTHDISFLNVTPLDHLIIEEETNKDPVLNKLKEYLLEDPQLAKKDETMKPFLSKLENFSVLQGCIFVDSRAVIPRTCQDQMLKLLHLSHIGINRMKSLARSSVWWPKMDSQIEEFVKECSPCMHHQTAPPAENTPWPRTNQPWQRVHVDHFYFRGDCYLLVVDANSNWIEVFPVRGTTSQENIKLLRECFARNTPTSLDKPPVERLLSYVPRTFVNCLNSEFIQKTFGRNECGRRHFQVGDKVLFTRVIQNRRKWFKAQVIRRLGYNVYLVKNLKGTFKVHVNQMRISSDNKYAEDSDWTLDNAGAGPHRLEQDPQISTSPPPRRSTRPRCPPCRFSPTMNNIRKEE
ncbi:K02A2.6-like [Cordylochernes scorpioides]|uniref:RNA-directed DNA polymerase n=1 Tax=Cordylochernes scorpioides TaxID=51811 RepID=A0ABY6LUH9_9ARAC|nr:K02A2.6-like [Cordylochernes scorpioides]